MKIAIGLLSNRGFKPQTVESLLNLSVPYEKLVIMATQGYTISENRNYIAAQAIKNECTHLLFIDDDMVFPPDTLERLLADNKEIVGVVAHSRMESENTTVILEDGHILKNDAIPKELFKCQHIGTGVMLIDLRVFQKIQRPWFDTKAHETGWTMMGEDAWFCKRARNAGYEIWCDPLLSIGHIGDYIF